MHFRSQLKNLVAEVVPTQARVHSLSARLKDLDLLGYFGKGGFHMQVHESQVFDVRLQTMLLSSKGYACNALVEVAWSQRKG